MAKAGFTEAELESEVAATIKRALPFLPPGSVKHQTVFTVRLGRKSHTVEGNQSTRASGRCDILIKKDGKPLAILELKRPGLALTDDDREQGLSYAKLTEPWAPLVIVTNGEETQIFSTFSGKEWAPETATEEAFSDLFANITKIAENELRQAVQTLIGPSSSVWVGLVRAMTDSAIDDLRGPAANPLLPYSADIFFPRKASSYIFGLLSHDTRCIIVSGGPLCGKSNVLLGLVLEVSESEEMAALFIDTGSSGHGVLQSLANAMTQEFGWGVTKDDVRTWLIQLSKGEDGPRLVLVVDSADADEIRSELDELTSGSFGPQLQLVLAVDDVAVGRLTRNVKGTQLTRIGTLSEIVEVDSLDDKEFETARKILYSKRISFMHGAHRAPEYRRPWVLRWIAADAQSAPEYHNSSIQAAIPSMMGLSLIWGTKERFASNPELVGQYTTLAEAVLEDIDSNGRSVAFRLSSLGSPVAALETARSRLGEAEFNALIDNGFLKHAMLEKNERIVIARIPELLMTTLPVILGKKITEETRDGVEQAAKQFISRCGRLFAGDLIGAQAIVESASTNNGLPISFLEELLQKTPRGEGMVPGSRMKGFIAEGVMADFLVLDDGRLQVTGPDGHQMIVKPDEDEQQMWTDFTSWQVLSHIAALPFAAQDVKQGSILGRLDPAILIEVGSCRHPVRPTPAIGVDNLRQHEVPGGAVVCHREGIIEPITYALMRSMLRERELAEQVVDEALSRQSLPLLLRLHIALSQVAELHDKESASWAKDTLNNRIGPRLSETGLLH